MEEKDCPRRVQEHSAHCGLIAFYIADSGHAPYGERDAAHVLARSRRNCANSQNGTSAPF
jgi:glutamate racemase